MGYKIIIKRLNIHNPKKWENHNESDLKNRPEALNLINIYSNVTAKTNEKVLVEMSGKEFSYLKNKLSEALVDSICPLGKKIRKLMDDKGHLLEVLKKGKEKATIKSEENLKKVREIVGLL